MRPIMLQGHTRAITQIKYNREGDLIFSAAKDQSPCIWYSQNGERLGTFDGHNGAVWCIDVDWKTSKAISGGGDMSVRLWDVETGKCLNIVERDSAVRTCLFSYSGNMVVYSTDSQMGKPCEIFFADVRDPSMLSESVTRTTVSDSDKVTAALWGPLDETIVTGHSSGKITQWDLKTNKIVTTVEDHTGNINDMQPSKDGTMFITSSRDNTSKLFDTESLECLKTYKTERPVNSASISPNLDNVVLGGGQEAMKAAIEGTQGKFEARFFHLVFEEEFARVKGHFGPINSLAFHPAGNQYTSGAEDGFLRIHHFDQSYFDYKFDFFM